MAIELCTFGFELAHGHHTGKFVRLRAGEQQWLCLATTEKAAFHADIVMLFCDRQGLAYTSRDEGRAPLILDERLRVLGGGRHEHDAPAQFLRLYGVSLAYGPFERAGLPESALANPALAGYTLLLDDP